MKQFTTPGVKETRQIIAKTPRRGSKRTGRINLEAIKAKLDKAK